MLSRSIGVLLAAMLATGCGSTLFNQRNRPIPRPFPEPRSRLDAGTARPEPRPAERPSTAVPPEPWREAITAAPTPSAPADELTFNLERGQGVTQALAAHGCDPLMLADAVARSNIRLSELNRLSAGREIRVARTCNPAPPTTAHLSRLILEALGERRTSAGRIAGLERQLAAERESRDKAETAQANAEGALDALRNELAKLTGKPDSDQALAAIQSERERIRLLGGKDTFERSLAALEEGTLRLLRAARTADLETALAQAELRFNQTFRRWPWVLLALLAILAAVAVYALMRRRERAAVADPERFLGRDNYRETDRMLIIRRKPLGFEDEYAYSHQGIDPADTRNPKATVVYYRHIPCGAENIKGDRYNLSQHAKNCPRRQGTFVQEPEIVRP